MATSDSVSLLGFPQTGTGRSASEFNKDIAEYVGLRDDPQGQILAGRCIRRAIGSFNNRPWTFNRLTTDIDLSTPVSVSGEDNEYDTDGAIRNTLAAWVVDSDGNTREYVEWVEFSRWLIEVPQQKTLGTIPRKYTWQNLHQTGRIIVHPSLNTATLTHPTMRLHFHRRIVYTNNGFINVPEEVEEAIEALAVSIIVQKRRPRDNQFSPTIEQRLAVAARLAVENEYGDFADFEVV